MLGCALWAADGCHDNAISAIAAKAVLIVMPIDRGGTSRLFLPQDTNRLDASLCRLGPVARKDSPSGAEHRVKNCLFLRLGIFHLPVSYMNRRICRKRNSAPHQALSTKEERMSGKAKDEILHDHNHDGIDRRGFLKCMAWAGTGAFCVMQGGVLKSYSLSGLAGLTAKEMKGE